MSKVVAAVSHDGRLWVFCDDGAVFSKEQSGHAWATSQYVPGTPANDALPVGQRSTANPGRF